LALLTHKGLATEEYPVLEDDAAIPAAGYVTVSLGRYLAEHEQWTSEQRTRVAVQVDPDEDVEALRPVFAKTNAVFFRFSKMGDGRPFTQARLLRKRLAYRGQIFARGPLIADQFNFLVRCGFDGAEVSDPVQPEVWARALKQHRHHYQPDPGKLAAH